LTIFVRRGSGNNGISLFLPDRTESISLSGPDGSTELAMNKDWLAADRSIERDHATKNKLSTSQLTGTNDVGQSELHYCRHTANW
jgi:hypothetical protein